MEFEVGKIPKWEDFVKEKLSEYEIVKGSQFEAQLYLAYDETMQLFKNADHQYKYKIEKLQAQLKEAEGVIEFYGDYNWKCSTPPFYDQGNFMDESNDYESKYGAKGVPALQVFGKKAREYQAKYKGKE